MITIVMRIASNVVCLFDVFIEFAYKKYRKLHTHMNHMNYNFSL